MTTIAYRNGVLAADTRDTEKSTIFPYHAQKVFKLADGSLFGGAGEVEQIAVLREHIEAGRKPPKLDDVYGIHIRTSGRVFHFESLLWLPYRAPFHAIGSGFREAMAAMHAGASAVRAVQIAIKMNVHTGGQVRTVRLTRRKAR